MYLINIPNIGETVIDPDKIPGEYSWKSDRSDREEFENENFLVKEVNSNRVLICSTENINALCDYICNYVFQFDFLDDMASIISPGMDLWSSYYQSGMRSYDSLPDCIRLLIDYFLDENFVYLCNSQGNDVDDESCYVMRAGDYFSANPISEEFKSKLENVCKKCVLKFWTGISEGFWDFAIVVPEPNCGKWGMNLYETVVSLMNSMVEEPENPVVEDFIGKFLNV